MLVNLKYTERNVSHVTPGQPSVNDRALAKCGPVTHERAGDGQEHEHAVAAVRCLHLDR